MTLLQVHSNRIIRLYCENIALLDSVDSVLVYVTHLSTVFVGLVLAAVVLHALVGVALLRIPVLVSVLLHLVAVSPRLVLIVLVGEILAPDHSGETLVPLVEVVEHLNDLGHSSLRHLDARGELLVEFLWDQSRKILNPSGQDGFPVSGSWENTYDYFCNL